MPTLNSESVWQAGSIQILLTLATGSDSRLSAQLLEPMEDSGTDQVSWAGSRAFGPGCYPMPCQRSTCNLKALTGMYMSGNHMKTRYNLIIPELSLSMSCWPYWPEFPKIIDKLEFYHDAHQAWRIPRWRLQEVPSIWSYSSMISSWLLVYSLSTRLY